MRGLIISAAGFEDTELLVPYYRLREARIDTDVASVKKGEIKGKHGYAVKVDRTLKDTDPAEYDLLVLPGGKAPAEIRQDADALEIARHFFQHNKTVSAICHGPQVLISAGLMKDRRATCYASVAAEMKKAGALYEDREVVVDRNLITSREPADLPAFLREIMKKIGHG